MISKLKRLPLFTVFCFALGCNFGVIDFVKNNDILYVWMLASGMTPTVPATYWVFGGWKAGLLGAVTFLSLPFVLTMLLCFSAIFNIKPRSFQEAAAIFFASASTFSGAWDLTFYGLTLEYWGGELLGDQLMWLPIAFDPQSGVVGICFGHAFGAWFIAVRLLLGLIVLSYYEFRTIGRRVRYA